MMFYKQTDELPIDSPLTRGGGTQKGGQKAHLLVPLHGWHSWSGLMDWMGWTISLTMGF